MTDDEIQLAISKHLGWTDIRYEGDEHVGIYVLMGSTPLGVRVGVPDYPVDLNAMEAVARHVGSNGWLMVKILAELLGVEYYAKNRSDDWVWKIATATARQRAEAFLKTVGKWKEESK